MSFLLLGCLSFAPLYLFDRLKLRGKSHSWLFILGCLGIFAGSAGCFFSGEARFSAPVWLKILLALLAAAECALMLYALFFALPKGTYGGDSNNEVVDTGLYALCRHPGVLCFGEMHLYLWLLSGRDMMLMAAICLTLCDVLHVYVQDRIYFPRTLTGYGEYQKTTPFLIPNRASMARCVNTFR